MTGTVASALRCLNLCVAATCRWFYITFNGGVVLAALGTPALTTYASPTAGFVVLGACGVAALLVFLAGTSLYKSSTLVTVAVTPSPAPKNWTPQPSPRLTLAAIRRRVCCRVPKTTARERRKLWAVAKIYMPFVVFWALFFNICTSFPVTQGWCTRRLIGVVRRVLVCTWTVCFRWVLDLLGLGNGSSHRLVRNPCRPDDRPQPNDRHLHHSHFRPGCVRPVPSSPWCLCHAPVVEGVTH